MPSPYPPNAPHPVHNPDAEIAAALGIEVLQPHPLAINLNTPVLFIDQLLKIILVALSSQIPQSISTLIKAQAGLGEETSRSSMIHLAMLLPIKWHGMQKYQGH